MSQQGKKYTDEQLKEIANWSIGKSVRDTCARFGCHGRIVLEARSKFVDPSIEWPTPGVEKTDVPQHDINTMQQMRNDGMSILDVSAATGYSRSIVDIRTVTPKPEPKNDIMNNLKFDTKINRTPEMSASTLQNRAKDRRVPDCPVNIVYGGEIIGTFTPVKSAH